MKPQFCELLQCFLRVLAQNSGGIEELDSFRTYLKKIRTTTALYVIKTVILPEYLKVCLTSKRSRMLRSEMSAPGGIIGRAIKHL